MTENFFKWMQGLEQLSSAQQREITSVLILEDT